MDCLPTCYGVGKKNILNEPYYTTTKNRTILLSQLDLKVQKGQMMSIMRL